MELCVGCVRDARVAYTSSKRKSHKKFGHKTSNVEKSKSFYHFSLILQRKQTTKNNKVITVRRNRWSKHALHFMR